jgi:hypothetical protein
MKKKAKKLVLSKETVRSLGSDRLEEVNGGICATSSPTSTVSVHEVADLGFFRVVSR